MRTLVADLEAELAALAAADRKRACPEVSGLSRVHVSASLLPTPARDLLCFASNDYLGLAAEPALALAAADAAQREGTGASASRLVTGDLPSHRALEAALSAFLGRPSALLFPTGFQTNVGVLGALAGRGDLIVSDALNHASIIDGCRLSRARVAIYPHGDARAARRLLRAGTPFRRRILVTESLFSMDGDQAPLVRLAEAAAETNAILIVDEAHALGCLGPDGRGLSAAAGIDPDVLVGTLGKAFGAAGGFAAGAPALRQILVNRARAFIYTTALPPPVAAAAAAALRILSGPEGMERRRTLDLHRRRLGERLRAAGLLTQDPPGPIIPVILGSEARALAVSRSLLDRGILVPAIRPPTVPPQSSRLRITLSAAHTPADLDRLAAALVAAAGENPP